VSQAIGSPGGPRDRAPGIPTRVGIAGFGRLARRYYLPAFRGLAGIHVVAVADPLHASQAAAKAKIPRATIYSDHRTLLAHEPLDALLVASPPSTHLRIWNDASQLGLPVFMEKPLALHEELVRLEGSAQARSLLMVDFNRRFWPTYQRLGAFSRGGVIGRVDDIQFLLHVNVLSWCSVTRHRLSPSEGGVLYDLGSQALDLISSIVPEEPVRISAEAWSERWASDHLRLFLHFTSGLTAQCDLAYTRRNRERVVIHGSAGRLRLDDPNMTIRWEPRGSRNARLRGWCRDGMAFGYRALWRDRSMMRYSIRAAIGAFLRSVRGGEPFSPSFEDAVRVARWLEAAWRSGVEGRPVSLICASGSA